MTWEDAIVEAIRKYFNSDEFEGLESMKSTKYNKKYFDSVKSEMLPANKNDKKEEV